MEITFWEDFKIWWCHTFHSRVYWPVNGVYRCASCHRQYAVPGTEIQKIPAGVYYEEKNHVSPAF